MPRYRPRTRSSRTMVKNACVAERYLDAVCGFWKRTLTASEMSPKQSARAEQTYAPVSNGYPTTTAAIPAL